MDLLPVLELERAAAGCTVITLGAISSFTVQINSFGLLADGAENG